MRATLLCLTILIAVPFLDAAPAPVPGRVAKEKLETLKMRLPRILTDWMKGEHFAPWLPDNPNKFTCKSELRVLRRVGLERAKAVILFAAVDAEDHRDADRDVLLTVFLSYQDGCWTTEQFEANSLMYDMRSRRASFAFLMPAIDEKAAK